MKNIELNSKKSISYKREGNLVGETIVFVHSFLWEKEMWDEQIKVLKAEYDCISIDLYGHGQSGKFENEINLKDIAEDVLDVVDELGIVFFHYVGSSLGSMIGVHINNMCSQVESFTFLNSNLSEKFLDKKEILNSLIAKVESDKLISSELASNITNMYFTNNTSDEAKKFEKHLLTIKSENIPTLCNIAKAMINDDLTIDSLRKMNAKTSFLIGENNKCEDKITLQSISNDLKDAHVYSIANASYTPNMENTELVNRILARLFDMDESAKEKLHFFFKDEE